MAGAVEPPACELDDDNVDLEEDDVSLDLDNEDNDEELSGLIPRSRSNANVHDDLECRDHWKRGRCDTFSRVLKVAASLAILIVTIALAHLYLSSNGEGDGKTASIVQGSFTCPETVGKSKNDRNDDFDFYIEDDLKHENKKLKDFKKMKLDGWGIKFQEVRHVLKPWKEEIFVNNIQTGDAIYESGMGIGMNLFISAEILKDHNITNITVSGNDYVGPSIAIANTVWEEEEAAQLANKGTFCQADSTQLDFVPDESFDFVYTGYIDPIVDPLNHWPNLTVTRRWKKERKFCESGDEKIKQLVDQAQRVQHDWFASWINHLVRIAKPSKVIAIENSAQALCTDAEDWGGVDKSWWKGAIQRYGWDVDPDSLIIRDMVKTTNWYYERYHVMMRKRGK